jgi:hypothetical protein
MDFFGLARGYGMSCGFMLMGLFHFIQYLKDHKRGNIILFHFAVILASLSSFTLITFYIALLLVYNLMMYLHARLVMDRKFEFLTVNSVHLFPLFIAAGILYKPVKIMITWTDLGFGGKNGFYADTVTHVVGNAFSVDVSSPYMVVLKMIPVLIVLISLSIIVKKIIQKKNYFFNQYQGFIAITFSMLIIPTILILQHLILGSDYPISRFSIFLFPLVMIQLGFFLQYLKETGYRNVVLIVVTFAALASLISFCKKTDFHVSAEWAYDSETKDMIQTLSSIQKNNDNNSKKVKLGINWLFEPTINFYRETKDLKWLLPVDRNGINQEDDYFYIFKDDLCKLENSEYAIIKEYKSINTVLIKNKIKH